MELSAGTGHIAVGALTTGTIVIIVVVVIALSKK